jgi:ribosomal protein S18 acetylase RimI-like enzyme
MSSSTWSKLQRCEWDSRFFGIPIGRASIFRSSDARAAEAAIVRDREFQLIYVFTNTDVELTPGFLADPRLARMPSRTVLSCPIRKHRWQIDSGICLETFNGSQPKEDLMALARASGASSRFRIDPALRPRFAAMFEQWMANSLTGEKADVVFVTLHDARVTGMITVQAGLDAGQIGLLAVSPVQRNAGLGRALVRRALQWCAQEELGRCEVATQGNNIPALRLYKKEGFSVVSAKNVFHFWTRDTAGGN